MGKFMECIPLMIYKFHLNNKSTHYDYNNA